MCAYKSLAVSIYEDSSEGLFLLQSSMQCGPDCCCLTVLQLDFPSANPTSFPFLPQVLIPREQLKKILHTKAKSKTKIEKFHWPPIVFSIKKKIYIYIFFFLQGPIDLAHMPWTQPAFLTSCYWGPSWPLCLKFQLHITIHFFLFTIYHYLSFYIYF